MEFVDGISWIHGGLGKLCGDSQPIIVVFSASGRTPELLNVVRAIKKRRENDCVIWGVFCQDFDTEMGSDHIGSLCDDCVCLGSTKCLEVLESVPTASITVQESFVNGVVAASVSKRGLTHPDFIENHPAGTIGQSKPI